MRQNKHDGDDKLEASVPSSFCGHNRFRFLKVVAIIPQHALHMLLRAFQPILFAHIRAARGATSLTRCVQAKLNFASNSFRKLEFRNVILECSVAQVERGARTIHLQGAPIYEKLRFAIVLHFHACFFRVAALVFCAGAR